MRRVRPITASPAGIICLHGLYEDRFHSVSARGYDDYLRGCAERIVRAQIRTIVLCGGHIHPNSLHSEARIAYLQFYEHLGKLAGRSLDDYRILLDEESHNGPQDIAHGLYRIQLHEPWRREVHVFVDKVRWFPSWVLTRNICWGFRTQVHGVPRLSTHPSSSTLWRQLLRGLYYLVCPKVVEDELDADNTQREEMIVHDTRR